MQEARLSRGRRGAAIALGSLLIVTLAGGCKRELRAREREALEAQARAEREEREAARRAAEPPPVEPPVELLRQSGSGLPCAVDEVFVAKCRRCHTIPARHGAPVVFLTWEDTRQDRGGLPLHAVIGRAVRTGFMPAMISANPPVQPLTEDEKKIILDWVDAGAPRGDCDAAGTPEKTAPAPSASTVAKSKPAASAPRPAKRSAP